MASEPDLISGLQAALEEDREPPADVLAGLPAEAVTELRTLNERADTKALHERLMSLGMSKMGQRAKAIKQLQAMPPCLHLQLHRLSRSKGSSAPSGLHEGPRLESRV